MVKIFVADAKRFPTMLANCCKLKYKTFQDYTNISVMQQHFVIRLAALCVDCKQLLGWQVQFVQHANMWHCVWQMFGTFSKNMAKWQNRRQKGKKWE